MIFAIRPDTLSSRTDICFIKPQDLLALSKAICAWRFSKNRQLSRSEILNIYSSHRQEERGGKATPESNISTGDGTRSRPDDPPACIGWKLKCPIYELPSNIIVNNFYARLSLHNKDLLDASCSGSFTRVKEEAKWDLLDRIQENTEGWEIDKGRKSGINYDYECIKSFMGTDDFHNVSAVYGLHSQIPANCFMAFASYLDVPKKDWNNYQAPYKDTISCVPARITKVCTVDRILPEPYFEKTPFPADKGIDKRARQLSTPEAR
jgi:hypothetical protein